jgi:hypothetical protein
VSKRCRFFSGQLIPFITSHLLNIPNRLVDEILANNGNSDNKIMVAKKMPKRRKIFEGARREVGTENFATGVMV